MWTTDSPSRSRLRSGTGRRSEISRSDPAGAARWVPRVVVEAVQLDQVREHGGLLGLRDEDALEAALARARQRWTYDPGSDLPRLAAAYTFGLCSGHPFRDGNKRISFLAAVIFLGLNGLDLVAPAEEVVEKMWALASGELDEGAIADWFRLRVEPRPESGKRD